MEYLIQQPETLQNIAIERLANLIAAEGKKLARIVKRLKHDPKKADMLISQTINGIRNLLEHKIAGIFYNELVAKTMLSLIQLRNKKNHQTSQSKFVIIVGRLIETLFTKNLTSLTLTENGFDIFQGSLYSKSILFSNLTSLKLKNTPTGANFINLFGNLHNLTLLELFDNKCDCTEEMLEYITDNCTLIETLHISCTDINDSNIYLVTKLRHLKCFTSYETTVTKLGIAAVLLSCEDIERIELRSRYLFNQYLLEALEFITAKGNNVTKQFKLKSYTNNEKLTLEQANLILRMCPDLQKLTFNHSFENHQCYLTLFNGLQKMHELTIVNFKFYADQVNELLQVKGHNLIALHLQLTDQIDFNALKYVCQTCPNLQILTLSSCTFTPKLIQFDPNLDTQTLVLRNLKKLVFGRAYNYRREHVFYLLSICPNVEFVDVQGVTHLSDKIISNVLDEHPKTFTYLKKMLIRDELSKLTIDRIIENCLNSPEITSSMMEDAKSYCAFKRS